MIVPGRVAMHQVDHESSIFKSVLLMVIAAKFISNAIIIACSSISGPHQTEYHRVPALFHDWPTFR